MAHENHSKASRMVAAIKVEGLFSRKWELSGEKTHSLRFNGAGHQVHVHFSETPENPDHILIRCTNWRAEDEPRGWVTRQEARAIYRRLTAIDMVAF